MSQNRALIISSDQACTTYPTTLVDEAQQSYQIIYHLFQVPLHSLLTVLLSRMTMMSSPSNFFLISQNIKPQIKVTAKTINPYRYFLFSFYRFHNHYL